DRWIKQIVEHIHDKQETNFDTTLWDNKMIEQCTKNLEEFTRFITHKINTRLAMIPIPEVINTKFKYLDTRFFHTFTRRKNLKPAHQQEFDSIFYNALDNYKKQHK
ncbi:12441_t:CDS:1, partial [Dentiscutata heterogama]